MTTFLDQTDYEVEITVPEQFTPIPLAEDRDERIERTLAQLATVMPDFPLEQRAQYVLSQEVMIERMLEGNVRYAGTLLAKTEDAQPRITTANLTLVVQRVDVDGTANPLAMIENGLKLPGKARETAYLTLPAGRALVVAEQVEVPQETTPFGVPAETVQTVRQIQAMVLFPDEEAIAVLGLSTQDLETWPDYTTIFRNIANTMRFFKPGASNRIADRLSGF